MTQQSDGLNKKTIHSAVLGIMGCIVLYWFLHEPERPMGMLRSVIELLTPFLLGACIAFILNVPMRAIENMLKKYAGIKNGRLLSIVLTFVLIVLIISFVVYMLVPQIRDTVRVIGEQFPGFVRRTQDYAQEFLTENPRVLEWIQKNTDFESMDFAALVEQAVELVGDSVSVIVDSAVSAVGSVISGVWSVVISLVFCFYCLGNKEQLARQGRRMLYAFVREKWADEVIRVLRLTNSTFSNFFSGQCLEVCILGCMFAVSMTVFRMPYVPLVSVLVAVTAFIPIVGAWLGCVLGAFFILVNDPMQAVWFVVLFLVLQQIENNVVYPRVVGTSVGLPSMWVLFSVSIGGKLMGVAGMVLMIPMVSVIYTLLRDITSSRVQARGIAPEKLTAQPPVLKSKLKEQREINKKRREDRRAAQLVQLMKRSFHIPGRKGDGQDGGQQGE